MAEEKDLRSMPLFSISQTVLAQVLITHEAYQLEEVDCPACRSNKALWVNIEALEPYDVRAGAGADDSPDRRLVVVFRCGRCSWQVYSTVKRVITDDVIRIEIPLKSTP